MCEVHDGFKFCTCTVAATGESGAATGEPGAANATAAAATGEPGAKLPDYQWYLTRFIAIEDTGIMGSIVAPSRDLGKGLTREKVLDVLNSGKGFDFEYSPSEQDSLRISRSAKNEYAYMSFLYQDGQWIEGMHPTFTTKSETISSGKIGPVSGC